MRVALSAGRSVGAWTWPGAAGAGAFAAALLAERALILLFG